MAASIFDKLAAIMTIDSDLYNELQTKAYQEYQLAAGHEVGVHTTKRGTKRPEGFVMLVDGIPFTGHTTKNRSAAGEAFRTMGMFLAARRAEDAAVPDPKISFAMAAVGLSLDKGVIRKPSKALVEDLLMYPGAVDLKEMDFFAARGAEAYKLVLRR